MRFAATCLKQGRLRPGSLIRLMVRVQDAIDTGMRAQLQHFRSALAAGMPRLGWKIGVNDPGMLERLGLADPVVGWLSGTNVLRSGARYALRPGGRVGVEAEVAVRVGGGGSVQHVAPALEIVDYSLPADGLAGILEHDIFHDTVVLGRETFPVPIADGDWPIVTRRDKEVARRHPSLIVLQPTDVVRRVAKVLRCYGESVEAGDWIIAGSLIQPISVTIGDRVEADFGPLGRVAVEIGG